MASEFKALMSDIVALSLRDGGDNSLENPLVHRVPSRQMSRVRERLLTFLEQHEQVEYLALFTTGDGTCQLDVHLIDGIDPIVVELQPEEELAAV
jgi:hypothetical protein